MVVMILLVICAFYLVAAYWRLESAVKSLWRLDSAVKEVSGEGEWIGLCVCAFFFAGCAYWGLTGGSPDRLFWLNPVSEKAFLAGILVCVDLGYLCAVYYKLGEHNGKKEMRKLARSAAEDHRRDLQWYFEEMTKATRSIADYRRRLKEYDSERGPRV